MIRTTVAAHSREESVEAARVIGADWFGCKPSEVKVAADQTWAETDYEETTDMVATYAVPTTTTYYTNYRIYGPGEY